jgi:AcrR family transcriptional regulator
MHFASHPPQQKRTRDSLERLMTAGLEVLAEDGWEAFTIAAVAKRADVGTASIYRRFEDKDTFKLALHRSFSDQLSARWLPAFRSVARADLDLEMLVRKLVGALAESFRDNERVMRAIVLGAIADPRLQVVGNREVRAVALEFEDALLAHSDQFGAVDAKRAVAVCFQTVFDSFTQLLLYGGQAHPELGWDELPDELSRMTLAYLRAGQQFQDPEERE